MEAELLRRQNSNILWPMLVSAFHHQPPLNWTVWHIIFVITDTSDIFPLSTHDQLFAGDVLTEEEVMMLINAADKDGDGSLDFQEFVKIMMWYMVWVEGENRKWSELNQTSTQES